MNNGKPKWDRPRPSLTAFDRYYDREAGHGDDYTWGEVVWKAARKALLAEQRKRRKGKER